MPTDEIRIQFRASRPEGGPVTPEQRSSLESAINDAMERLDVGESALVTGFPGDDALSVLIRVHDSQDQASLLDAEIQVALSGWVLVGG